ncbi:UNVERIFIED_CONTAM: hypothetical protein HHA_293360 [Hammondia hammondi]|eukprot:XP_008884719.1 hypothetical protein HHA_293360 [Hammondia hammondi]
MHSLIARNSFDSRLTGDEVVAKASSETSTDFFENQNLYRMPSKATSPERAGPAYMDFDAAGNPILIPVRPEDLEKAKNAARRFQMKPEVTGTTADADDGELEENAEGLERTHAKPTGAESEPAAEEAVDEDAAIDLEPRVLEERIQPLDEHIVSFYSMPSTASVAVMRCEDESCPQPLSSFLPDSPFITKDGTIAVDVYAVKADMTVPEELATLPKYSIVPEPFERKNTLFRSMLRPSQIDLF